jgi:nucleoside-diphosphate-sugar epimerase
VAQSAHARFLLASTSEVYGDPLVHPQPETYWGNVDPIGPRSMYDEGKRFAEALVVSYVRERGADARIVRIFNAYGPRMQINDGRMPSTFIAAALSGESLPVHGDGSQTRSLCFVTDTARGLIAAMERGASGEVYNIGRSDEMSVIDFARMVARVAGTVDDLRLIPGRPQEIQRRCPDTTKAGRDLGWYATTRLEEGLRITLDWYRRALPSAPPPRELAPN